MRKRKDPDVWFEQVVAVAADPSASSWLKRSLKEALNLDPVDADKDATILQRILSLRVNATYRGSTVVQTAKPNGRMSAPEIRAHERIEADTPKR